MRITEISRRIWLFSANKIKTSESVSKQSTQLKLELNSSLRQKLGTLASNFSNSTSATFMTYIQTGLCLNDKSVKA